MSSRDFKWHHGLVQPRQPTGRYNGLTMAGGDIPHARLVGLPFADLIDAEITKRSLTLQEAADGLRSLSEGRHGSRASPQLISTWRNGEAIAGPFHRRLIAKFFDLPLDLVTAAAETQKRDRNPR
jgi:hypothetical protein